MSASACTDTSLDSKVILYEGGCGNLTCLSASDDGCNAGGAVSWQSKAGAFYQIQVTGFNSAAVGAFSLRVDGTNTVVQSQSTSCPFNLVAFPATLPPLYSRIYVSTFQSAPASHPLLLRRHLVQLLRAPRLLHRRISHQKLPLPPRPLPRQNLPRGCRLRYRHRPHRNFRRNPQRLSRLSHRSRSAAAPFPTGCTRDLQWPPASSRAILSCAPKACTTLRPAPPARLRPSWTCPLGSRSWTGTGTLSGLAPIRQPPTYCGEAKTRPCPGGFRMASTTSRQASAAVT
jgi:hypothetical protein